ncbi:hypothetical protein [Paralysiella testudinis]|uniref:hypothetical protein n=1 Tax=Paralysiella testudinis TaxID=2809020 RepID=UPI001E505827|nr:hypothetical protein [Paralysiella testudinis]
MKTPNPTPLNLKLATGTDVAFVAATVATEPRRFSGIANSGRPFVLGDINMVVDFEGIQYKAKTAVLVDHSGGRIAGVAELSVTADGLLASGTLLGNEHGQAVAAASDEGFPWEMSAYVQAARYEELLSGATATVNGHEVSGPMLIMRDCTIREVSFMPTAGPMCAAAVFSATKPTAFISTKAIILLM